MFKIKRKAELVTSKFQHQQLELQVNRLQETTRQLKEDAKKRDQVLKLVRWDKIWNDNLPTEVGFDRGGLHEYVAFTSYYGQIPWSVLIPIVKDYNLENIQTAIFDYLVGDENDDEKPMTTVTINGAEL